MKALLWITAIAFVAGVGFLIDGALGWPHGGNIFEVDPKEYSDALLSLSVGSTLFGIALLTGLLALHAKAVGDQMLRAIRESR